jgi:hypothetical protein
LRCQPAAEDIAVRICVLWHGDRLDDKFASGLVGHEVLLTTNEHE